MTTTVVAYTSLRAGHVTRFISLRTSVRNVRPLFHHPVMPPLSLPPAGLTCSIVAILSTSLSGLGIRDSSPSQSDLTVRLLRLRCAPADNLRLACQSTSALRATVDKPCLA